MDRYSDVVQNENGRAVPGASILIVGANGQPATIFFDRQGTLLANPFSTDLLGRWSFCAADGIYSARISLGGVLKATVPDIRLEDPDDGFASLANQTGATLVGTTSGQTVQQELDELSDAVGGFENYTLLPATATRLGGVIVSGNGLGISPSGILFATGLTTGSVSSVNGKMPDQLGSIVLSTNDIAEPQTPTNLWFTDARVRSVALTGLNSTSNTAITAADTILTAPGKLQAQVNANKTAIDQVAANVTAKQDSAAKDASGGYAGLTGFSLNLKNSAGNVVSQLSTLATAARSYVLPDKAGTVVLSSDLSGASVVLAEAPVGAVANIDYLSIFTSSYTGYKIELLGVSIASSSTIRMQVASGGTLITTTVYRTSPVAASDSGLVSPSLTAGDVANITIDISSTDAARMKSIFWRCVGFNTNPAVSQVAINTTSILSGFRIFPQGVSFSAGGIIRVTGVRV